MNENDEALETLRDTGMKLHAAVQELDVATENARAACSCETGCLNRVRVLQKEFDAIIKEVREQGGKHGVRWEKSEQ